MQEDKEGLFDTVDRLLSSLEVFAGLIKTLKLNAIRMPNVMTDSYMLATELAD
jgi:argininosuccinate lyase